MCKHWSRKINIGIVVLETPAEDFGWKVTRPQGILSETVPPLAITKTNKEVSKIRKHQKDGYVTHHLKHTGDIDLGPSSISLNLLKGEMRQHDASYFPQLMHWYIKIMESTINTMILIFSFHENNKLTKVYSTNSFYPLILQSSLPPKFPSIRYIIVNHDTE